MAGLVVLAVGVTGTVVLAVGDAVVMSVRGKKCHICFLPYIYIYRQTLLPPPHRHTHKQDYRDTVCSLIIHC